MKGILEVETLQFFNSFIKLSEMQLAGCKAIPDAKLVKIKFIDRFILQNKCFFAKSEKGTQLCTTSIGKALGVTAETVMNWIKSLIKLRLISCTNTRWIKGKHARHYKIIEEKLITLMNKANGYTKKFKQNLEKWLKKKNKRQLAWNKTTNTIIGKADFCRIAQCYLGCPESYLKAIKQEIPLDVLESQSLQNSKQTVIYDAVDAYNYVNRQNNFCAMTFEQESLFFEMAREDFNAHHFVKTHQKRFMQRLQHVIKIFPKGEKRRRGLFLFKNAKVIAKGIRHEYREEATEYYPSGERAREACGLGQEAY